MKTSLDPLLDILTGNNFSKFPSIFTSTKTLFTFRPSHSGMFSQCVLSVRQIHPEVLKERLENPQIPCRKAYELKKSFSDGPNKEADLHAFCSR